MEGIGMTASYELHCRSCLHITKTTRRLRTCPWCASRKTVLVEQQNTLAATVAKLSGCKLGSELESK